MSKYHPLDVRHPANRALERRNFLLDPPRADLTKPPRPRAERRPRAAATTTPPAAPAAPWGRNRAAASTPASGASPTQAPTRFSFGFSRLILIGVALYLLNRSGALEGLLDTLSQWLDTAPGGR